jgi:capsular exopolysaccharide synthesis family protein
MSTNEPIRLPPPAASEQEGGADAGRMLQILWRGKWILLALPLAAFFGARAWLGTQVELYVATAMLQVDAREVDVLRDGPGEAINKSRTVLKQQQGLLKSTPLMKRVVESPELQALQTFQLARLRGKTDLGELFDNLDSAIDVESDRLFITYKAPFRTDAVAVADAVVAAYFEHHREEKKREVASKTAILRPDLEAVNRELEQKGREILELQEDQNLLVGQDRTPLQGQLDNANTSLNAAHARTLELEADFRAMETVSADPAAFRERGKLWRAKAPVGSIEERLTTMRTERADKEAEVERRDRVFGPDNPVTVALRSDVAALLAAEEEIPLEYARYYLAEAKLQYERGLEIERELANDVQALQGKVTAQNLVVQRLAELEGQRGTLRERAQDLTDTLANYDLANQTGGLNLTLLESARAGSKPAFPEVEKTMIYALGGSAILAFGLVLLIGLSDRRVRDVEDVPRLLGTSVLGVLPELPYRSDRARIARAVEEDPHSLVAEAIRSVRTATAFALPDGGRGIVALTSASTGEGKSVCASNLAVALARAGKRTLLVDADMRKPAQHEIYAVENAVGLAGLLSSGASVKKAILADVAKGLDLLPAGNPHGKAAELCEGRVLAELFASLRETYECIVVDAPPVLETSEARVLAALADVSVFVLRLDQTRAPSVKRAAGILRGVGARILGALPNGAGSLRGARAFAGGISYGNVPEAGANQATRLRAVGDEPASDTKKVSARGTDFLGLEEESA